MQELTIYKAFHVLCWISQNCVKLWLAQSARSPIQMNNRFIDFLLASYLSFSSHIQPSKGRLWTTLWTFYDISELTWKMHLIDSWNNEQMILWKTQVYFNKKILINTSKDINRLGMSGKGESFNCLLQFFFANFQQLSCVVNYFSQINISGSRSLT